MAGARSPGISSCRGRSWDVRFTIMSVPRRPIAQLSEQLMVWLKFERVHPLVGGRAAPANPCIHALLHIIRRNRQLCILVPIMVQRRLLMSVLPTSTFPPFFGFAHALKFLAHLTATIRSAYSTVWVFISSGSGGGARFFLEAIRPWKWFELVRCFASSFVSRMQSQLFSRCASFGSSSYQMLSLFNIVLRI